MEAGRGSGGIGGREGFRRVGGRECFRGIGGREGFRGIGGREGFRGDRRHGGVQELEKIMSMQWIESNLESIEKEKERIYKKQI